MYSHCLVRVHVTQKSGGQIFKRQFLFCDLAGRYIRIRC